MEFEEKLQEHTNRIVIFYNGKEVKRKDNYYGCTA